MLTSLGNTACTSKDDITPYNKNAFLVDSLLFGGYDKTGKPIIAVFHFHRARASSGQVNLDYKLILGTPTSFRLVSQAKERTFGTLEKTPFVRGFSLDLQKSCQKKASHFCPEASFVGGDKIRIQIENSKNPVKQYTPNMRIQNTLTNASLSINGQTFTGSALLERFAFTGDTPFFFGSFDWMFLFDPKGNSWFFRSGSTIKTLGLTLSGEQSQETKIGWRSTFEDEYSQRVLPDQWSIVDPTFLLKAQFSAKQGKRNWGKVAPSGKVAFYGVATIEGFLSNQKDTQPIFGFIQHIEDR